MNPEATPTVFIIDDDAGVRASIQGLLKSVGLRSQAFAAPQEFLEIKRSEGPCCLAVSYTHLTLPTTPYV